MIRIRLINEGKVVKQITSRVHEGVVMEQISRYAEAYDTVQIVEGDLSEDARSMLQRVAKKIVPAAMAAGMAMSGAQTAQAQGGANPNYPGLNRSVGQTIGDIVNPRYKEMQRQREHQRSTEREVWNAEQNEIRRQRVSAARTGAGGQPSGAHQTIYDQSRISQDGKSYLIYGMDNRVRRIPVSGTEYMPADSQRLSHYITASGNVYYVRHPHMNESITEGVAESVPMQDAVKVLRQYGAGHFKTTSNELHFYKNGQPFSVDLISNSDATRSVSLSQLNSAGRKLKGQGVEEGKETPESEVERLKLRQNAEHGKASLQRQAATQARIRELEKQIKDKSGVAEGVDIQYHQTSGTKAGHTVSSRKLSNKPQASKSDVTLQSGSMHHSGKSYNFPKGTVFTQLPGGIFAQHPSVPETTPGYGHLIRKSEDNIRAIHSAITGEQGVAEVSKATLDRYVPKAVDAHGHADFSARMSKDDPTKRSYHVDQKRTAEKRRQGISRALDRMSKVAEGSLEEIDRRGFLKGMGAAAAAGAAGAAGAGDFAGSVLRGAGGGMASGAAGKIVYKDQNEADMAFADKIPDEWDKIRYTKAVKSIIRSRGNSVMRYMGSNSTATRGSIMVDEKRFNRLKTELSQKYNIPMDQVKEQGMAEGHSVTRGIDKERYTERPGLEGPFSTRSGKVVYYDKAEGKYYDPDTDFYIGHEDYAKMDESDPNATVGTIPSTGTTGTSGTMSQRTQFAPTGKTTNAKFNKNGQIELDADQDSDGGVNLDADAVKQLQQAGVKMNENQDSPVAAAIARRIMSQRLDLLKDHGPALVTQAIDQVADFVGDVEEIGSSDVSGWVKHVEQMLRDNPPEAFGEGLNEGTDTLDGILSKFSADYAKFRAGGDIDENQDFFDALYDYYHDQMPYGVQKARTGDPYEWITQQLDQEGGVAPVAEDINEGAEQMTPNWAKYVLDQLYNSNGAVTLTDLFDEHIPGLHAMFMDTAKAHGFDPEEDFEDVQHELTVELEDLIKGGHGLDEADEDSTADQNIIMQIRKASDYERPTRIKLADGTDSVIAPNIAKQLLAKFDKMKPDSKTLLQDTLNTEQGFTEILDYFGGGVREQAAARASNIMQSAMIEAGFGRDRRDAYQRDYDNSVAGMGKRQSYAYSQDGGANDEDHSRDEELAAQHAKKQEYERTGKFWLKQKDTQQHVSDQVYTGKAAANAAAVALLKQQPELKGNLVITAYGPLGEASLAQMRDYFTKNDPDSIQVARNNETPLRTKNPEGIPPQIQALVNKMYHAGKISPEEFETLRQFQRKTKINVGIREADKEQPGEQV